ncbi:uncharacterized protein LOC110057632 isoform X2 [Orbicella faveolata]|uniref:uncharacterized protein LOC110057632 isoform X2 n=1 Tax=Orbicella faveolata TaxID=48498 RepID=UPI0009E61D85|nr:uncharacterized protein LOC110057632 isoform X2 [Orbicella faveolata]
MASSEKQMIPLEDISLTNEDLPDIHQSSTRDLVDVKLPSRPRRKVVIIAGVIAVLIVLAVAGSLIGKYVPKYLSEANNKSEKGSKDKGTGEPKGIFPSSSSSGKCFIESYFAEVYVLSSFVNTRKEREQRGN